MSKIATDLANRLKQASQEMGNLQHAGLLKRWTEAVESKLQEPLMLIDVYVSKEVWDNNAHGFKTLLNEAAVPDTNFFNQEGFRFQVFHEDTAPIRKEGDLVSSISVILLDQSMANHRQLPQWYKRNNYAFCLVLTESIEGKESNPFYTPSRGTLKLSHAQWHGKQLAGLIKELFNENILLASKDRTALLSLNPVIQVLGDSLSYENQLISVRRSIINQQNNSVRKDETQLNISDLSSGIRSLVQQVSADIEREIKLKYDDLNRPVTGRFSNRSIESASSINDLDQRSVAEKAEKVALNIKDKNLDSVLQSVNSELAREFDSDKKSIGKSISDLTSELNRRLTTKFPTADQLMTEKNQIDPTRTLNSFVAYNKFYGGEMIKKGVMEYFVSVRDYVGLVMVVSGLIMPLLMGFSAMETIGDIARQNNAVTIEKAEGGGEIAVRNNTIMEEGEYRTEDNKEVVVDRNGYVVSITKVGKPFVTVMRVYIQVAVMIATFGLMVYGISDLRKRIPAKRKEEFERELNKARELIGSETKRIYAESSRDWSTSISNWIREYQTGLLIKVEKILKEESVKMQLAVANQKSEAQKMTLGIDNLQKRIASIQTFRDQLYNRYRELQQESDKTISSIQLNPVA